MKSVAIIGAGPGGLVAAKTLLRSKKASFKVRVFDKKASVGGLWAVDRDKPWEGMVNPNMPSNISRINMGFSDFSWQAANVPGHLPLWPKAWMSGWYLQAYANNFIPQQVLKLNTRVTKISRESGDTRWHLTWEHIDANGTPEVGEEIFDHLIMATGFFPEPYFPPVNTPAETSKTLKQVHSTALRSLADVGAVDPEVRGTILVVGGGISGADAATVLAAERATARNQPGSSGLEYESLKIAQIVTRPFYPLPVIVPKADAASTTKAPTFIPLDLFFYDLGKKTPGDIELGIGTLPPEMLKGMHEVFQGILGVSKGEAPSELEAVKDWFSDIDSKTAFLAITEHYSEYVRSGDIELVPGRFEKMTSSQLGTDKTGGVITSWKDEHAGSSHSPILGVVYATGFDHHVDVSLLPKDVLQSLEYDPDNIRLPIILDRFYILRADVPNLAFVGFHEGNSWPAMEMQARFIENSWSSEPKTDPIDATIQKEWHQKLREIRKSVALRDQALPVYWLGDFVGYMESVSRELGIKRNDLDFPTRTGPMAAARYAVDSDGPGSLETKRMLDEYHLALKQSQEEARFVARAAFRAMQGRWVIHRDLNSFLPGFPSGLLDGSAEFLPRYPTDPDYDAEYLYREEGSFTNDQGMEFKASRGYVYRYQESTNKLTAWFVKEDGKTVDYFFHDLVFNAADRKAGWIAKTDHLCIKDMYKTTYSFQFKGVNLEQFNIMHAVKGPQKDYLSDTRYKRPVSNAQSG